MKGQHLCSAARAFRLFDKRFWSTSRIAEELLEHRSARTEKLLMLNIVALAPDHELTRHGYALAPDLLHFGGGFREGHAIILGEVAAREHLAPVALGNAFGAARETVKVD